MQENVYLCAESRRDNVFIASKSRHENVIICIKGQKYNHIDDFQQVILCHVCT